MANHKEDLEVDSRRDRINNHFQVDHDSQNDLLW
jgi:hypothetical protein